MKKKIAAVLGAALVLGGLAVGATAASAVPNGNDGKVCEDLSTGHITPSDDVKSLEITAPEGKLISKVCVKSGSVKQGNGPEYTYFDPAVETVVISHSSGKDISHYAVGYSDPVCLVDETHTELVWDVETWTETEPAKEAVPASIVEGWYTEADDAAPTVSDEGLTFTAPGGQAVGIRTGASFPVADLVRPDAPEYTDVFHYRAVVDAEGEPFGPGHWRNDYLSLTFLTADTVWVAGANVEMTLEAAKAAYPGTITSVGYHMDSNAAAGTSVLLASAGLVVPSQPAVPAVFAWVKTGTGQGVELPASTETVRYVKTGEVEVTEQVPGECPLPGEEPVDPTDPEPEPEPSEEPTPTEEPKPTEKPTPVTTTASTSDVDSLAETGAEANGALIAGVSLALVGGIAVAFGLILRGQRKTEQAPKA